MPVFCTFIGFTVLTYLWFQDKLSRGLTHFVYSEIQLAGDGFELGVCLEE